MNALIDAGANVNKTDSNNCSALTLGKKNYTFLKNSRLKLIFIQ